MSRELTEFRRLIAGTCRRAAVLSSRYTRTIGLKSLQEFEQSLLRDFTASSFQVGEGR